MVRKSESTESMASTVSNVARSGSPPSASDSLFVHEAGVEVAELLRLATGGRLCLFDDGANRLFRLLAQDLERAVARLVRRDGSSLDPRLIDVQKEIILRSNRLAELVERKS